MGEETSSIYNAIIISLIIGIIITIAVLFITFEEEEHFSEIYFEEHENLPEKIKLNNNYKFSFTVHSLENSTKIYDYKSKIELYNLYDITEGTYRCLGKFRDRIRLKWELGELIDNNTYLTIKNYLKDSQNNGLIKNAYTEALGGFHLEKIEWDKFTIDFSYQTIDGIGNIGLIFIDDDGNNKYALILSEAKNKILFVKFDNNQIRINKKDYNFITGRGYRITINAEKNKADIYINDQQIFNIKDISLKNTKLGFETRNTYAYIRPLKILKHNYNLKDSSTIKSYDIDESVITKEHNDLIDKRIDYLKLETAPDENNNLFDSVYEWMNLNYDEIEYNKSFKIRPYEDKDSEIIGWTNYLLEYDYETLQGDGKITALFKDLHENLKYAFMIDEANNEVFFLRAIGKKLEISKKKISIETNKKHNVKIRINKNDMNIYIDEKLIFNITDLSGYTGGKIGFELKNTNAIIDNVYVQNEDINYSDPTLYVKYKKKYGIEKSEFAESKATLQDKQIFTNPAAVKETFANILDKADIENDAVESKISDLIQEKGILENPEEAKNALIKEIIKNPELIDEFIDIVNENNLIQESGILPQEITKETLIKELITNPNLIDDIIETITSKEEQDFYPNIPSKSIVFDGYNARILNWTDYVFTFDYTALDGKKEIIHSIQDFDGNNKYSFLISERTNEILFTDHINENEIKNNITVRDESWNNAKLEIKEDNAKYYFNGRLVFNLTNVDFTTVQFSLGTESTNAHFRRIFALNNDGQRKIYEIQEDPCELQKIRELILDEGNIIIESGKKMTKDQTLNVNQLFDFGKVSINVDDREIHFWVTNI